MTFTPNLKLSYRNISSKTSSAHQTIR